MNDRIILNSTQCFGSSEPPFDYFLRHFERVNLAGFPNSPPWAEPSEEGDFVGKPAGPAAGVWFGVENFPAAYQKLRSRGVLFLYDPIQIHNSFAVEFQDPFGNQWGITSYDHRRRKAKKE
jgi:hypothetical protein